MASRADYLSPTKEFPDHATFRAAGAHRDQPVSVRFELVGAKEALHHRFLAYSSPSRSPNPRHLTVLTRPGFVRAASHPHRRPPDQAAPSFDQAATTAQRRRLSPLSTFVRSKQRTGAESSSETDRKTQHQRVHDQTLEAPIGRIAAT